MSLRDAAERLGVHYMTAYRYVRLGLLPAVKRGATWHVDAAALDEFSAEAQERPSTKPAGRKRRAPWERRLEARLLAGDERGAWGVVEAAEAAGMDVRSVYLDMIVPALRSIGEGWHRGEISIREEHRATAIVYRMIGRLGPRMTRRGRTRGTVVLGTLPGERHHLPVTILADFVRAAGFEAVDLGCDLPVAEISAAASEADRVVAIGLSVTFAAGDAEVAVAVATLHDSVPGVPVLVGGNGIEDAGHAERLGADYWAGDAVAAVDVLEQIGATSTPAGGSDQRS